MVGNGLYLGGRYEVISRIGRGGMADVYKALDRKLNRFVAIKVLKKEFGEDKRFVERFRSEASSAASLSHPNIVTVYDVAEEQGVNYIVMELVEGITLKEYIEKRGKLSAKEAISISIQVAMGIEAAHKNHIIHRDIKPQNIMISKEGKVKVADFGIARAASVHTVSSSQMGSVHYTSPEQARGGFSDARSDIYSLGVTMYEMITGRVPFDGDSTVTVAIKHLQEEVISPSEFAKDISYSYEQIILKCIQKSPEARYTNIAQLIDDLKMSLVNPNGNFVKIDNNRGGETVIFTGREVEQINEAYDDYEDDYYDDEPEDNYDDYDEFDDDGESNPKLQRLTKVLVIVAAVLIGVIIIFVVGKAAGVFKFGSTISSEESEVKVPNVVGMDYDEAKEVLNKKGLGIKEVDRQASEKYKANEIISQSPYSGKKVKKNTTIEVVISTGEDGLEGNVPDVVGMSQEDAQKELENKGFKVETKFKESDDVESGYVISQKPDSTQNVKKGGKITITVSKGGKMTSVPSVIGMDQSSATSTLKGAGLKVGTIKQSYSSEYAVGLVISQTPESGSSAKLKSTVNLVVSKGEDPASQIWQCNATINLDGYEGNPVTVTLTQSGSSSTIIDGQAISSPFVFQTNGKPGVKQGTVTVVEHKPSGDVTVASQSVTFKKV